MFEVKLKAPLNVEWEITKLCNLRCRHCYLDAGERLPKELNTKEALELVAELDQIGISDMTLSGGEPFMREDLWEILYEIKRKQIPFTIYTNGTLLDSKKVQRLAEIGINMISISLNGAKPETHNFVQNSNTFGKVLSTIRLLKNKGIQVQILYTLMRINSRETDELLVLAEDLGIDYICVYPFYVAGRGKRNLDCLALDSKTIGKLLATILTKATERSMRVYVGGCLSQHFSAKEKYSLIKGAPCAKLMAVITADGHFRPCNFLPFETKEGLRERKIAELWKDPLFQKIRDWNKSVRMSCSDCEQFPTCFGLCLSKHLDKLDLAYESELRKLSK